MDNQTFFTKLSAVIKDVAAKDKKAQKDASSIVDNFVKQYRSADENTKGKINDFLSDREYLDEITRPEIKRPNWKDPRLDPSWLYSPHSGNNNNKKDNASGGDFFKSIIDAIRDAANKARESVNANGGDARQEAPGTIGAENGTDIVEYIYAPGDTFARALIKSGLSDGSNLWGPNGDVEYYSQQLRGQGINGNIPVGTKIRLRRRK